MRHRPLAEDRRPCTANNPLVGVPSVCLRAQTTGQEQALPRCYTHAPGRFYSQFSIQGPAADLRLCSTRGRRGRAAYETP